MVVLGWILWKVAAVNAGNSSPVIADLVRIDTGAAVATSLTGPCLIFFASFASGLLARPAPPTPAFGA